MEILIEVVVIIAAVAFWLTLIFLPDKRHPRKTRESHATPDQTETSGSHS